MTDKPNYDDSQGNVKKYGQMGLIGMTSAMERSFLHWYAMNLFTGAGEIVDLGSWLGSTVVPLLRGLVENKTPETLGRKVFAYDRFKWVPSFNNSNAARMAKLGEKYQTGDFFLPDFEKLVEPWKDRVTPIPCDLLSKGWGGGPIEFIHVDAMKSWDLANRIYQNFFPYLIPGVSFIAHQDFAHYSVPQIHLTVYGMRQYFEPVYHVPGSDTVVFKYIKKIPDEQWETDAKPDDYSEEYIQAAYEYCTSLVSPKKRSCVALARPMLYVQKKELDRAESLLNELSGDEYACELCTGELGKLIQAMRQENA